MPCWTGFPNRNKNACLELTISSSSPRYVTTETVNRSESDSVIELYFDSNLEMLEFTAGGGGDGGEDEFKPKYFLFENAFRNQSEVMRHLIK